MNGHRKVAVVVYGASGGTPPTGQVPRYRSISATARGLDERCGSYRPAEASRSFFFVHG